MRTRRREDQGEAAKAERRRLGRLDDGRRAGVLAELQRAGGNSALQRVIGPELQRDTATAEKPASSSTAPRLAAQAVLSIDGSVVGAVRSYSGLTVRTEVIAEGSGSGAKHTGALQFDPCVLQVGLGMGKGFFDWIRAALSTPTSKDVVLHLVDSSSHETAQYELRNPHLSKVELPELAAGDTSPAWLTVTIVPEYVKTKAGSGAKIDTKQALDPINPSTVSLDISGIGRVTSLTSVAPWSLEVGTKRFEVGQERIPEIQGTKTKLRDIGVTISGAGKGSESVIAAFDEWTQELLKGLSRDQDKRTAVLSVSSKGGRKLELQFSGVGLASADILSSSDAPRRRYAMYVERAKLLSP